MFKKILLAASLLIAAGTSSAALVVTDSSVTGADMAGLEVSVTFANGVTETAVWEVVNDTPVSVSSGDVSVDAEVLSGGAFGSSWALTQGGFTLGAIDNGSPFGDWELSNLTSSEAIIALSLNGMPGGVVFDIVPGEKDSITGEITMEVTPGSKSGLHYVASDDSTGEYSNQLDSAFEDLFWQLDVRFDTGIAAGQTVTYFADTDLVEVPAPSALALILGGIVFLARQRFSATTA